MNDLSRIAMRFFSQQGEDSLIFEKYLSYRDGFFIELGAMDGVCYSNSLFFESQLGWKGILIEPTKDQFDSLVANRPGAHCFNYAISETEGEVEFLGSGAVGGMTHTMQDEHRDRWNETRFGSIFKVRSIPISKIVSEVRPERVDMFSIDVEGGEKEVLSTFDWSIPVYLIVIEGEYRDGADMSGWDQKKKDKYFACREILIGNGFEYIEPVGGNEIWINHSNKRQFSL